MGTPCMVPATTPCVVAATAEDATKKSQHEPTITPCVAAATTPCVVAGVRSLEQSFVSQNGVCKNGCGRTPFKHYKTCCKRCHGPNGPHNSDCLPPPTYCNDNGANSGDKSSNWNSGPLSRDERDRYVILYMQKD